MLLRIGKDRWISIEHIVAVTLHCDVIIISLATKSEAAQIAADTIEGKAFMYWLERNANDILKHYEGLRNKDEQESI